MYKIGILALQGNFAEHQHKLEALGASTVQVRYAHQMADSAADRLDALVIPGGESTAIARLTDEGNAPIFGAIKERALAGMPIWGTCMGSIFLAKEIEGSSQGRLALMDIKVRRNAFGPQKRSFETQLSITALGEPDFHAVFIRAPLIVQVGESVEVLASLGDEQIVMARQGHLLASSFHPEMTDDARVHQYFLSMVEAGKSVGVC